MQMPFALSSAIDAVAYDIAPAELARASEALTINYRDAERTGAALVTTAAQRGAYVVVRMPATYAAIAGSMGQTAGVLGEFAPRTMLDLGAGPGTAMWAAAERFPSLEQVQNVERDGGLAELGARLAAESPDAMLSGARWTRGSLLESRDLGTHDLVTICYVLNELAPEQRPRVLEDAWRATRGVLLVVEAGTPTGFRVVLEARAQLARAGGQMVAPCPQDGECPLAGTEAWCHFSQRLARSGRHRAAKGAALGYEDEKYSFVAFAKEPVRPAAARVISTPEVSKPMVRLKLCTQDGIAERTITRREKDAYKEARRLDWGDSWRE